MFLLFFICTFLIVLVILLYDRYSRTSYLISKIPGPTSWPIVGNSLHLVRPLDEQFLFFRTLPKYGDTVQMHAMGIRTIFFYNPVDIEKIMSSVNFNDKNLPYYFMKPWLGEGLLTSQGTKWHKRRKLLTHAFHFNILKKYAVTFVEQAERFLQQIDERSHEEQTDIVPLIATSTLRTMCETAMGSSTEENITFIANKYSKSIEAVGQSIVERMCRFWLQSDLIFKWSNFAKIQNQAVKEIHEFTNEVIDKRRTYLEENNFNLFKDHTSDKIKKKLALLDLLLVKEKSGAINMNDIREEVDTFMFEGHDTTSTALNYLLMNIANETDVQEKIWEELDNIFGDSKRTPTIEDLNQMKYLECCIKESLRLYPSVPLVCRYVSKETKIGDFTIPKCSHIVIGIYDLHRREDIYPEPEKFVPERFFIENSINRHPYAYIPFSPGPRNCIGQKFAMLEMKALVSMLLLRYRLEPVTSPKDLVYTTDLVLRINDQSIFVKFSKRI